MPDWAYEIRRRLSSVRLSPMREAEIVEELSQHLDDRRQDLIAGGTDPEEATRLALAGFRDGDMLAKSLTPLRQAKWSDVSPPSEGRWFWLHRLLFDIRQGVRALRSAPGFTVVALAVLTLGIGATTAIVSVVDAVIVRGLPFRDAERLVAVGEFNARSGSANPSNHVAVGALLILTGLAAAFIPARRAASVDPLVSVRME